MRQQSTGVDSSPARPLSVTYRATASLKPDPRNARTHSKRQVEHIIASIREFGFTNPILLDPEGVLIAGHGRLLAAKSLGMGEVPTIELVGLNDAQKRALRLADNKIALGAGWDLDLLKVELAELSVLDVDMETQLGNDLLGLVSLRRHRTVLHMAQSHTSGRTTSQGADQGPLKLLAARCAEEG
jgi:hypothetical protein